MKLYLVNYADEKFYGLQRLVINNSRRDNGYFTPVPFERNWLITTEFYKKNKLTLDTPRGGGLWLWKPFIISEVLKIMDPGDCLLYADCGDLLLPGMDSFFKNYMVNNDIFLISAGSNQFCNRKYTKRECFLKMNCTEDKYLNSVQLEAGICGFKKCQNSEKFIEEWLTWCLIKSIIDDEKDASIQDKEFIDHRHDQSILTNLQIKYNIFVDHYESRNFFRGNYYK